MAPDQERGQSRHPDVDQRKGVEVEVVEVVEAVVGWDSSSVEEQAEWWPL